MVGVESVDFNNRMDDLHSDSLQSVQSGYHTNAASSAVLGALGLATLNKILGIPCFSGTERKKTLFGSNSGTMPFQVLESISMSSW